MLTIYSDRHSLHRAHAEPFAGTFVEPFESPKRAEYVLSRLQAVGLGEIKSPADHGLLPILRIHDQAYVEFLQTVWTDWTKAGFGGQVMPNSWPGRNMASPNPSSHVEAKVGYYALCGETGIVEGSWEAAYWSAQVALTALDAVLAGDRSAFALCRPPGHHAPKDQYGGYCFLNNAAIAAQAALDQGHQRVAILDVDFHHGNVTQEIFYDRSDVLFLSIHGTPDQAFPYFLGWADEVGTGAGQGFNVNYPLPTGTPYGVWRQALHDALGRIQAYAPDLLIISLGLDTYEKDPISFFKLTAPDYIDCGGLIAGLGLPTLFVMEGGYAVDDLGINTVNVLQGFEAKMKETP